MKIFFVINALEGGGAARVISLLANHFVSRGFEVKIILTTTRLFNINYTIDTRVEIITFQNGIEIEFIKVLFMQYNLRKKIIELNPDVVIPFLPVNILLALVATIFTNIPVIASERNDPYNDPENIIIRKIRDFLYTRVDGIVFQTEEAKEYFNGNVTKNSIIIPNPYNFDESVIYKNQYNSKQIIAVGRLEKQKNHKLLIGAFKKIECKYPEYILTIYGDGDERDNLEKLCGKLLNVKIFLPGLVKNIKQKMIQSEIFVLTSDFEGMPNALIEAMSLGIPCISTDCSGGGPRFLIDHNINGLLVPVRDIGSLAIAMEKLINDKELSNRLTKEALKIGKKLDVKHVAIKWIDYLESVVRRCRNE